MIRSSTSVILENNWILHIIMKYSCISFIYFYFFSLINACILPLHSIPLDILCDDWNINCRALDADFVDASSDAEEAILSPFCAPGVLHLPELLTRNLINTVAHQKNYMVHHLQEEVESLVVTEHANKQEELIKTIWSYTDLDANWS